MQVGTFKALFSGPSAQSSLCKQIQRKTSHWADQVQEASDASKRKKSLVGETIPKEASCSDQRHSKKLLVSSSDGLQPNSDGLHLEAKTGLRNFLELQSVDRTFLRWGLVDPIQTFSGKWPLLEKLCSNHFNSSCFGQ